MEVLRLDERECAGRIFCNWLRAKLCAVGQECKRMDGFAFSDGKGYVVLKDDLDEIARDDDAPVPCIGIPLLDGKTPIAGLADIEADLFDGERDLAIIHRKDSAILVAAPVLRDLVSCAKGDVYVRLSAAEVRERVEYAQREGREGDERGRDGRCGGDDQRHDFNLHRAIIAQGALDEGHSAIGAEGKGDWHGKEREHG